MFFNWVKTAVLMAALMALLMVGGHAVAGPQGVRIAFLIALVLNFGSYWFSDKLVLGIYRAKPLTEEQAPALHRLVAELATRAEIPKPRVYLINSDMPNAFATGRNPAHGVVAVTRGITELLDSRELAGVLAHEISHIKHRDTLISALAATIAAAISYLGYLFMFFGGSSRRDGEGSNPLVAIFMMLVAPIVAGMIQLAVSRSREYMADERGARIAGEARGLASALQKLEARAHAQAFPGAQATEHVFIVNPFRGRGRTSVFSTHPSTQDRVRRLEALAAELGG